MNNSLFLYYILFVCLLSCKVKTKSDPSRLKIKEISSKAVEILSLNSTGKNQKLGFYIPNKLDKELYPYIIDSREPISKIKKIIVNHSSFLLGSSLWLIPYYVHPGDKLNVFVNADGLAQLSIEENNIRNNELNFFLDLHYSVNRKNKPKNNKIPEIFFVYSKRLLNKQMEFSNEYFRKNKVSQNFINVVENYLFDEYLSNVYGVYSNNKMDHRIRIPEEIKLENISEKINLRDPKIESFAFYKSVFSILDYFFYNKNKNIAFRDGLDSCNKYFKGKMLEYAKFRIFDKFMDKDPKDYNLFLQQFLNSCRDSSYVYMLRENYKPYKENFDSFTENFFDEKVESMNNESLKWKNVLSKYKGKIIILDFWARWCLPCIEELPYIKKLKEGLDEDKVKILLISIDVNKITWERGLKENELEAEKDSYLIINSSKSLILKKYKIEHVPRYIILNGEGNVIVFDAPRPSQRNDLKTILLSYIK